MPGEFVEGPKHLRSNDNRGTNPTDHFDRFRDRAGQTTVEQVSRGDRRRPGVADLAMKINHPAIRLAIDEISHAIELFEGRRSQIEHGNVFISETEESWILRKFSGQIEHRGRTFLEKAYGFVLPEQAPDPKMRRQFIPGFALAAIVKPGDLVSQQ